MAEMYYDNDADLNLLKGKKIAVMGYGSRDMHRHRTCMIQDSM